MAIKREIERDPSGSPALCKYRFFNAQGNVRGDFF